MIPARPPEWPHGPLRRRELLITLAASSAPSDELPVDPDAFVGSHPTERLARIDRMRLLNVALLLSLIGACCSCRRRSAIDGRRGRWHVPVVLPLLLLLLLEHLTPSPHARKVLGLVLKHG